LSATAQRYAAALADVALERKSADAVKRDFSAFLEAFFASSELRNALESPAVNDLAKTSVVEKIAAEMGMNDAARNFVLTIVENRRTHLFRDIEKAVLEDRQRGDSRAAPDEQRAPAWRRLGESAPERPQHPDPLVPFHFLHQRFPNARDQRLLGHPAASAKTFLRVSSASGEAAASA